MSRGFVIGLLCLLLVTITAVMTVPVTTLVLTSRDGNEVLLIPVPFQRPFTLEYFHSVQKTSVQEHFLPAPGNQFHLTGTTYQSLGVGLPFLAQEGKLKLTGDKMEFTGMNRYYDSISLVYSPMTRQAILCGRHRYEFSQYFTPETVIKAELKQHPPIKIIMQES